MADLWNIGGALLGGLLGNQSSTQSTSNTVNPYAPAQPWINSNIASGQSLQKQYQAQPLSTGQIAAYGNALGLTEGFRNQASDLISQMNSMNQFDRNNPTAKATRFNFTSAPTEKVQSNVTNSLLSSLPTQSLGLLASGSGYSQPQSSGQSSRIGGNDVNVTGGKSWFQLTPAEQAQANLSDPFAAQVRAWWQKADPYGMASYQQSLYNNSDVGYGGNMMGPPTSVEPLQLGNPQYGYSVDGYSGLSEGTAQAVSRGSSTAGSHN